jgi:hypothetical protein
MARAYARSAPSLRPREETDGWGRVVCRLVLGLAQMIGAVAGVYLLFQTGINGPTLRVLGVMTLLTIVSLLK